MQAGIQGSACTCRDQHAFLRTRQRYVHLGRGEVVAFKLTLPPPTALHLCRKVTGERRKARHTGSGYPVAKERRIFFKLLARTERTAGGARGVLDFVGLPLSLSREATPPLAVTRVPPTQSSYGTVQL